MVDDPLLEAAHERATDPDSTLESLARQSASLWAHIEKMLPTEAVREWEKFYAHLIMKNDGRPLDAVAEMAASWAFVEGWKAHRDGGWKREGSAL